MGKRIYMCMSVRGALKNCTKKQLGVMFSDENGKRMTADQARDALLDEIAQGHEVIPMSNQCGNPCKNAGCTGFDYAADGGCPGCDTESKEQA